MAIMKRKFYIDPFFLDEMHSNFQYVNITVSNLQRAVVAIGKIDGIEWVRHEYGQKIGLNISPLYNRDEVLAEIVNVLEEEL
jgi:hypothetical protein